jgi:hypothetical protein
VRHRRLYRRHRSHPNGFGDFAFDGTTGDYRPFTSTHNSPLPFVNV